MANQDLSGNYIWIACNCGESGDIELHRCCQLQTLINSDEGETQLWTSSAIESPPIHLLDPMIQNEVSPGDAVSVVKVVDGQAFLADIMTLENRGIHHLEWTLYRDESSSSSSSSSNSDGLLLNSNLSLQDESLQDESLQDESSFSNSNGVFSENSELNLPFVPLIQNEVSPGDAVSVVKIVDGQAFLADIVTLENRGIHHLEWTLYRDESSSSSNSSSNSDLSLQDENLQDESLQDESSFSNSNGVFSENSQLILPFVSVENLVHVTDMYHESLQDESLQDESLQDESSFSNSNGVFSENSELSPPFISVENLVDVVTDMYLENLEDEYDDELLR